MNIVRLRNFCLLLFLLSAVACGKKTESATTENDPDEWPQLDSFHMIMAEAYHPYKDSANVEPAKAMAEELAKAAEDWQRQPIPSRVDDEEMKARLNQLVVGTRTLADRVKAGASDQELGAALTALHENFHKITEAWEGGQGMHQH